MAMIDHSAKRSAILAQQDAEAKEARDAKQVVQVFLWTLFFFKVATLAVLLVWIDPREFWLLVGVSAWPWFVIPGIALAGPIGYQLRLRRVRRKRAALRRAEWAESDTV
jgi:hypothetical protein